MSSLLSVIIPIYNVEKYLPQCIDSVLSQDYQNIEIILVDDGSPDKSGEICDDYAEKHNNMKVIHKSNGGLSDARNIGIQAASGEYVTFLDSDDYWNSQASLKNIMNTVLSNQNIDVFVFGSIGEYPDGTRVCREYRNNLIELKANDIGTVYKKCIEIGDIFESACIKLIKRSILVENSLYFKKGIISEDNEWSFRLMRCIHTILFIDETLVVYRARREGSITNTAGVRHIRDIMKIIELSKKYYAENPSETEKIGKYELAQCAYLWFISLSIFGSLRREEKKEAVKLLERYKDIIQYSSSRKTILCSRLCRILGVEITSRILRIYIWLMKNNIVSSKKKVK